nr:hypothetical protein [Tanacetum cinerariifolium]
MEFVVSFDEKTIQDAEKVLQLVDHQHLFQTLDVRALLSQRLLLVASLSCYASVIATSKRSDRLLALEVVAGCLLLRKWTVLGLQQQLEE